MKKHGAESKIGFWVLAAIACSPNARAKEPAASNAELAQIVTADQGDRLPAGGASIDWKVVQPRDDARRRRVMEMYSAGLLQTGQDMFNAALVLQHGTAPEDFLLSHELCVTALFNRNSAKDNWVIGAKWLAAASEDRFLDSIGRQQRFGTQYKTLGTHPEWQLAPVDGCVTDQLRLAWSVPSLDSAKSRELEMNKDGKK